VRVNGESKSGPKPYNNEQSQVINASSLSYPPLLRRQGYFIPFVDVYLWSREQVAETVVLSDPASGENEIIILNDPALGEGE
jgi:hypothetical protein